MATVQPGVWGIDLGQCALKAIRLEVVDGEVVATAFEYIEHPKILSQPDADPDQLTREALDKFLSNNQIRGDLIAISVPGQTGLARFVKLPVEPKKIPDIVKFEAKQQIPFPLDEVVWDYQTIGTSGQTEGFVENEIGLFAMKRDMINRYLQAFKEVGIEVHFVQMAPLALCNFVAYDLLGKGSLDEAPPPALEGADPDATAAYQEGGGKQQCVVALDIGADNTSLVVTDGEKIIWQRPIPIGGNHFTRALTKDMKLTFAKAEHLKRNATKAEDPRKIFQSMKPVFSDFVGEVQRSLGFFTNTHRNAEVQRLLGLGNAFRLPGLQKFISQSLGNELEKPANFERLKGDEVLKSPVYADNVLSFGVAYGLALQGLQKTRLKTNLLPQEIQFERVIRAKKPWATVAAACLFLGTAVMIFFLSGQHEKAKAAADEAQVQNKVIEEKNRYSSLFQTEQEELKKARLAAQAILTGSEERTNWLLIYRFLNNCLPQPDGTNLPYWYVPNRPETPDNFDANCAYVKYWTDGARRAWEARKERDEKGMKGEETHQGQLIQINLQSVWARYCDVPLANRFFTQVKAQSIVPESIEHAEWQKAPPMAGWAMELRGYTYHDAKQRFIMETLVRNLRVGPPPFFGKYKKGVMVPLNDPSAKWVPVDVSHVAILKFDQDPNWSPTNPQPFKYINNSGLWLDALMGGEGTGGMGAGGAGGSGGRMAEMGAGGMAVGVGGSGDGGGGAASGRSSARRGQWTGLGSAGGGAGAGGGMTAGGGGGGGLAVGPTGVGGAGASPMGTGDGSRGLGVGVGSAGGVGTGATPGKPKPAEAARVARTEFVIVLYWIEPLPTESASESKDAAVDVPAGDSLGPTGVGGAGP